MNSETIETNKSPNKVGNFFVKSLNGMAYGLFATLIIGTIFATIGTFFKYGEGNAFCDFMVSIIGTGSSGISYVLQILTGAGIGIGIALILKLNPLQCIVLAAAGEASAYFSLTTKFITDPTHPLMDAFKVGDPLTIYLVCIVVALFFKFVFKKKTSGDIILIPLTGVIVALVASLLIRFPAIYVTYAIQWVVNGGTQATPFFMGIVVAVIMGMALTAPISSAAIAAMVFTLPQGLSIAAALNDPSYAGLVIASGAAVVGCSTQMVGFAIQSIYDNKPTMCLSIGIGTSMLQFKNILKKPIIWLPTILASAILGPIATCVLKTTCLGSSAGMGTAGLVGQIGTISSMGVDNYQVWLSVFVLEIVAPALLVFIFDFIMRKLNLIKKGDLTV